MKTFLRKAIIAVAAMIASVNVMAQSFELKKSLQVKTGTWGIFLLG